MYEIKDKKFHSLASALEYAKTLNEFVEIVGEDSVICGIFGVDGIVNGKCPDGVDYTWMKRRK